MRTDAEVQWVPVRDVGDVRMGKQLSPASKDAAGQRPYLRVANVLQGRIDYTDVKMMGFSDAEREAYGLKPGDILLNEGQSLELVGRSSIYDGAENDFFFQNTLVRFRPSDLVLPAYAQVIFERWLAHGVFAAIAKQTTSIAHLGGERFASLSFPLRPLAEQRRIVEVIDAVSAQERAIEASIAKLSSMRLGALAAAFSPYSVSAEEKLWIKRPLEYVAHVGGGIALGGVAASGGTVEIPYLRVANVQDGFISTSEMKKIRVAPAEVERFLLKRGDVLLTEGGDLDKLGRGGVWDGRIDPCLHQNHVFRVRCVRGEMVPDFLALYLASPEGRAYFLRVAKQTTNLASVSSSQIKAMPVPCPPLPVQQRTVEEFATHDECLAEEGRELAKTQTLKLGLIDALLAGGDAGMVRP
ncbi:restriction endonuclease subunit S [Kitasatospora sp. NPDC058218]|uniref:restriction endonuclease subunit S n=1 Tax=Kitasatospora sp. NPDC058218 TaxID=3346385 RepID=UPI0036DBD5A8